MRVLKLVSIFVLAFSMTGCVYYKKTDTPSGTEREFGVLPILRFSSGQDHEQWKERALELEEENERLREEIERIDRERDGLDAEE